MSEKETKNVVASVLGRLRDTAKQNGAPFQQILQQYAIERFLYRISKSKHAQSVILKGALLLNYWHSKRACHDGHRHAAQRQGRQGQSH